MMSIYLARGPEGYGVKASVRDLRGHAKRMTDDELNRDFVDCLIPVAESVEDEAILMKYFSARKRAEGWAPRKKGANSHKNIGSGTK